MTETSRETRARLTAKAMEWQEYADKARYYYMFELSRGRLGLARSFQSDAAYFGRRARECLFELLGAEPEDRFQAQGEQ